MASPSNSAAGLPSADDTSKGAANPKKRKHIDFSEDTVPLSFKSSRSGYRPFVHTFQVHKSILLEHFPTFQPGIGFSADAKEKGLTISVSWYSESVEQQFLKWIYYQEVDDIAKMIDEIGVEDAFEEIMELHWIAVRQNMEDLKLAIQENLAMHFSVPLESDRLYKGINFCIDQNFRHGELMILKVLLKILVNNFTTDEIRSFSRGQDKSVLVPLTEVLLDREDERQKASEIEESDTSETFEVE